jgi:hypothetical protein
MNSKFARYFGLTVLVSAAAFCAEEVWNTKDPSVWTTEDANVVLNNSPWSKQIKLAQQGMGQRRPGGMGRRSGGMGYPGGGYPGGGYPGGGGGGYPGGGGGGGYPGGGGGGYPGGGGGGYPGGSGGGYPRGGGGSGSGGTDGISLPSSATVRWESAKPVQEAEARLNALHASYDSRPSEAQADAKPETQPETKPSDHYVVSLLGIRIPNARGRDDDDNSGKITNTRAYDQFMSTTQLVIKNKTPISPDKVKFIDDRGQSEIQFLFPKTSPITADDKEVTFQTTIGRVKVENKFNLKKMTRNGRLELD